MPDPEPTRFVVFCEPQLDQGEGRLAGMAVMLVDVSDPDSVFDVAYVGFNRVDTSQPEVSFEEALMSAWDRATKAAEIVNNAAMDFEDVIRDHDAQVARKHRDLRKTLREDLASLVEEALSTNEKEEGKVST